MVEMGIVVRSQFYPRYGLFIGCPYDCYFIFSQSLQVRAMCDGDPGLSNKGTLRCLGKELLIRAV